MRDTAHYANLLYSNPIAGVGFTLAACMVYAKLHGSCDGEDRSSDEVANISRRLKRKYGETLTHTEAVHEFENAHRIAAAATLGRMTSPEKARASAENGRLSKGRPSNTMCVCGHEKAEHDDLGICQSYVGTINGFGDNEASDCPCNKFTSKGRPRKPQPTE